MYADANNNVRKMDQGKNSGYQNQAIDRKRNRKEVSGISSQTRARALIKSQGKDCEECSGEERCVCMQR